MKLINVTRKRIWMPDGEPLEPGVTKEYDDDLIKGDRFASAYLRKGLLKEAGGSLAPAPLLGDE